MIKLKYLNQGTLTIGDFSSAEFMVAGNKQWLLLFSGILEVAQSTGQLISGNIFFLSLQLAFLFCIACRIF